MDSWGILAALAVAVGAAAGEICQGEECMRDLRIQRLKYFFDGVTPTSQDPPVTVKDVGQYVTHKISDLIKGFSFGQSQSDEQVGGRQERQYYGSTGYGNYYGNTGYGLYGGSSSSTSYNGLDAALSALAFLAFGVWLFNLVLPKLQGADLDLGGLGRTSALRQEAGRDAFGALSTLATTQDLINNIFGQGKAQSSRQLLQNWFGEQLLSTAENAFLSVIHYFSDPPTGHRSSVRRQESSSNRRTSRSRPGGAPEVQGKLQDAITYLANMLSASPSEHRFPASPRKVRKASFIVSFQHHEMHHP